MQDVGAKITAMVERALRKNPDLKSADLKERAAKIYDGIAKMSGRQFHAQYVIQVRKRLFGGTRKKAASGARRTRRRRAARQTAAAGSQAAVSFLSQTFEERKQMLEAAVDGAFERAVAADSVKQIDKLLALIERRAREFEKA